MQTRTLSPFPRYANMRPYLNVYEHAQSHAPFFMLYLNKPLVQYKYSDAGKYPRWSCIFLAGVAVKKAAGIWQQFLANTPTRDVAAPKLAMVV